MSVAIVQENSDSIVGELMTSPHSPRKNSSNLTMLGLVVSCCFGSHVFADEIISSGPVKSATAETEQNESLPVKMNLNIKSSKGNLKPPLFPETKWLPAVDRTEQSKIEDEQIQQASAETEAKIPPAPTGLDAPRSSESNSDGESVPEEKGNQAHGQEKVIESNVDIRPPVMTEETDEDEDSVEPCWTDPFVDDHLYLWSENREGLELLFNNGNGFGMTTLGSDFKITGDDGPLWANFKFGWHFLDGPTQPDIHSQTYDLSFEFNFAQKFNHDWGLHLQFTPTWSTDWDNKTGDAFRLLGGGLISYDCHDGCKFLIGGMYLDRPDLPFVPTVGLRVFEDDFEVDLVIPRPRVAWRCNHEEDEEAWFYIAGELGGGSWAVERELSRKEIMSYRDYRLLVGWETKKVDGSRDVFEMGWVFDRRLEFDRFSGRSDLDDTFVMRWGRTY